MNSFLQKIGVMKPDEDASPAATAPAPVAKPARFQLPVADASGPALAPATLALDETQIEEMADGFYEKLRNTAELQPMFGFLDAANKLTRITDTKTKYLATLDVQGVEPQTVLSSADFYQQAIEVIASNAKAEYYDTVAPTGEALQKQCAELGEAKRSLEEQLAAVEANLADNLLQRTQLNTAIETQELVVGKAVEKLNVQFQEVAKQLKLNLV